MLDPELALIESVPTPCVLTSKFPEDVLEKLRVAVNGKIKQFVQKTSSPLRASLPSKSEVEEEKLALKFPLFEYTSPLSDTSLFEFWLISTIPPTMSKIGLYCVLL